MTSSYHPAISSATRTSDLTSLLTRNPTTLRGHTAPCTSSQDPHIRPLPRIHTSKPKHPHTRQLPRSRKYLQSFFFREERLMGVYFGCSHAPTSRYDHHGDTIAIPPRYTAGKNDNAYPPFREDVPSRPGYVQRHTDGLINLPPVTHNPSPPIIAKARPMHHDPYSPGHRPIPRSNADEPPLSLVPMNNLIAHHPFPRDVQDEQVLRVFMPRLE